MVAVAENQYNFCLVRCGKFRFPKVGRIFLADISSHFCAFPIGKFHSGVLSGTDHST